MLRVAATPRAVCAPGAILNRAERPVALLRNCLGET